MTRIAFLPLGVVALAIAPGVAAQSPDAFARALDAQWDFNKPAISEQRFRAELAKWPPDSAQAQEISTQVARTLGLQRRFDEANAVLDRVEAAQRALPVHVRVRYLLERGRALNSSGAPARAVPLFAEALQLAERERDEFYAVDAAHMLGIAAAPSERLAWNLRALALAEAATDPRARDWRASLHHNIGWTHFDGGDAKTAVLHWQKALAAREAMGDAGRTRVARWTLARGYRALGRLDDAEAIQKALAAEFAASGEVDGYVFEELAEIALARGDVRAAQPWAAKAHAALRDEAGFATDEPARLARLAAMAAGNAPPPVTP